MRCSTTRPRRWSSTDGWWRPPRRSVSAGASTASARCPSRRGRPRTWPQPGAWPPAASTPATSTPWPTPTTRRCTGPPRSWASHDPWDHLRLTYARHAPGFLAEALPGLDPDKVRFVPHHVAHAASAALAAPWAGNCAVLVLDGRGERHSHLAGVYRGRRAGGARHPAAAALARPAVRGRDRAPGLPAQLRRVQGHGAGLLRDAARRRRSCARRCTPPATAGSSPAGVDCTSLAKPRRPDDGLDRRARRSRGQPPGGDRGGAARPRPLAARSDRRDAAGAGRRRRAQLRGQLPARARSPFERGLGAAGGRRRGHRARRRARVPRRPASRPGRSPAPTSAAAGPTTRSRRCCRPPGSPTGAVPTSPSEVAAALADDAIVAWFQGRSEFGPRALGHRSLLAHPGRRGEPGAAQRRQGPGAVPAGGADGADRAGRRRSSAAARCPARTCCSCTTWRREWRDRIPAVVHVDGTARIQSVDPADEPLAGADAERVRAADRAAGRGQHQPEHRRPADGRQPPRRAGVLRLRRRSTCSRSGPFVVRRRWAVEGAAR